MEDIVVNGAPRSVPAGTTVLGLLRTLEIDPARVAVELDRTILKAPNWEKTELRAGARVEIVHFVGGG